MIKLKNRVLINCEEKELFNFLSDFENLPAWNSMVKKTNKLETIKGKTRYQSQTSFFGSELTDMFEVDTHGEIIINARSIASRHPFHLTYLLDKKGGFTYLYCEVKFIPQGFLLLIEPYYKMKLQENFSYDLQVLKDIMEKKRKKAPIAPLT